MAELPYGKFYWSDWRADSRKATRLIAEWVQ